METWKNEPKPEPISAGIKDYFLQFGEDLKTGIGSEELTLEPGESVELTFGFGPDHPDTGRRTKTFKKKDWNTGKIIVSETGEEVKEEVTRPNFEVYNHNLKKKQNFWVADKWAKIAWETMQEYNTDTLVVKRIGEKKDTTYTFMPTGLRRSG